MKKALVTTAIDYVNADPHLGHCLGKIQADVISRYQRTLKNKVFFLTGTDENSLKNVQSAEKERVSTKELVDRNALRFKSLIKALNLSVDDFIRTTEERHIKGAQKFWQACQKDIYKKLYSGLYCVGCEEFYKEEELENGLCPEHKTKPELITEENYFFKLSKYQKELKEIIKKDKVKIIPESRKNEILSFINSGVEDICISRSSKRARDWGIDVPGDSTQKIWVWFDALANYITALGFGEDEKIFQEWWQKNNNKIHIIGKGISRFHAVYWPGMLLSAGLKLPEKIFIHGYLTLGGQKISKSLGNVIDPFKIVTEYGTDALRYYLLREISPTEDGDFTEEKLKKRYNGDLAGGIGNLVARVVALVQKKSFKSKKPGGVMKKIADKVRKDCQNNLEDFKFNESLKSIWELVGFCDKYINQEKPWEEKENFSQVISDLIFALRTIADLLAPFLPETSEKIEQFIKQGKRKALFPRV